MGIKVTGRQRSWQKFEVGGIQQSTGPLFEVMNRTTRKLVGGAYRFSWNTEVGALAGGLGSDVRVRIFVDGVQKGMVYTITPGPDFAAHSGFDVMQFVDGDQPNVVDEPGNEQ